MSRVSRTSRMSAVVRRLVLALLVAGLAGAVLAALAVPVIAGLGLTAKAGADDFLALPAQLQTDRPAATTRVLAADGSVLATFYRRNRVPVPFAQVPRHVRQAVIAVEDTRFYQHGGVDLQGTLRAALENARSGEVAQGGSTLTQQYVKNALLEAAGDDKQAQLAAQEQSADRKLREARYALTLERRLTKDEILDRYLQIAYFGNGTYGIGTAAGYYFDKPVSKLSIAEGAMLVGMVQNPRYLDPVSRSPKVRRNLLSRRAVVLARMQAAGFLDEATRVNAAKAPLPLVARKPVGTGCEAPGSRAPFFCDHLRYELEDTEVGAALGKTRQERQDRLYTGGLTIRTTLDPKAQRAAQAAVDEQLPRTDPSGAFTVSDVVQPGTGHIRAMAVDRGYGKGPGKTQVNYANGGGRDGYGFQGGSTFKAFDLAAALQKGLPLSTAIASPPLYLSPVFKTYEDGRRVPYQVRNAEPNEGGIFTMRRATELSVNTYFMQLAERTGLEAPIALAEALGVSRKVPGGQTPLERNPSTVLGAQVVSPLAMAGAYATFAARGIYCPPRATLAIEGPDGPLDLPPSGCGRALDQGIADTVTDVLRGVVTSGTGRDAAIGRPVAGKTGTTNESKAAWFVGYTPQLATAVWVGLPDRLGRPLPMRGVTIADRYYQVMYGGNLPASIWQQTMSTALDGVEEVDFPRPSREVLNEEVAGAGVPDVTGLSYDAAAAALAAQGFSATRGTSVAGSGRPPGSVVRTAPGPGSQVSANRIVYVYAAA